MKIIYLIYSHNTTIHPPPSPTPPPPPTKSVVLLFPGGGGGGGVGTLRVKISRGTPLEVKNGTQQDLNEMIDRFGQFGGGKKIVYMLKMGGFCYRNPTRSE